MSTLFSIIVSDNRYNSSIAFVFLTYVLIFVEKSSISRFPRLCCLPLGGRGLSERQSISLILIFVCFFGTGRTAELWPLCPQGQIGTAAVMSCTAPLLTPPNYPVQARTGAGQKETDTPRQVMLLEPLDHLTLTF